MSLTFGVRLSGLECYNHVCQFCTWSCPEEIMLYINSTSHEYMSVQRNSFSRTLERFNLDMLVKRRMHVDLIFLFKRLHGVIDCPQLLQTLLLRTLKYSTVSRYAFYTCHTVHLCPMCRAQLLYHEVPTQIGMCNPLIICSACLCNRCQTWINRVL